MCVILLIEVHQILFIIEMFEGIVGLVKSNALLLTRLSTIVHSAWLEWQ